MEQIWGNQGDFPSRSEERLPEGNVPASFLVSPQFLIKPNLPKYSFYYTPVDISHGMNNI